MRVNTQHCAVNTGIGGMQAVRLQSGVSTIFRRFINWDGQSVHASRTRQKSHFCVRDVRQAQEKKYSNWNLFCKRMAEYRALHLMNYYSSVVFELRVKQHVRVVSLESKSWRNKSKWFISSWNFLPRQIFSFCLYETIREIIISMKLK